MRDVRPVEALRVRNAGLGVGCADGAFLGAWGQRSANGTCGGVTVLEARGTVACVCFG